MDVDSPVDGDPSFDCLTEAGSNAREPAQVDDFDAVLVELSQRMGNMHVEPVSSNSTSTQNAMNVPQQNLKEWQMYVSDELRKFLVKKLMNAIFPLNRVVIFPHYADRIWHCLEILAGKVENDIYKIANSKSEYYHLLAERCYHMSKELNERVKRRREQQKLLKLQQQQQQ